MIGYSRLRQPERDIRADAKAKARAFVAQEITPHLPAHLRTELAFLNLTTDCNHPDGHIFVGSCGSFACVRQCGRIVWL